MVAYEKHVSSTQLLTGRNMFQIKCLVACMSTKSGFVFSYRDDCPMENEISQFDIKILPHFITKNRKAIQLERAMKLIPCTLMSSNFRYLTLKKPVLILMHIFQEIILERGRDLFPATYSVNSAKACLPWNQGGLGVHSLWVMNDTLLGKWL